MAGVLVMIFFIGILLNRKGDFMAVFILVALVILSGFLAGLGKKKSLKIIQAFLLVSIETLLGAFYLNCWY